jgi:hypothetical protein
MKPYVRLGPVSIRVSRKYLAPWGFPLLRIGGLSLWDRDSGGRLMLAAYHPKGSPTWHWFVTISHGWTRRVWPKFDPAERRQGQWSDYVLLPFGITLVIGRQDYHRQERA